MTFANITIASSPINIKLNVNESVKLNLSSKDYYSLFIKLESILSNKANITIRAIHELIEQESSPEQTSDIMALQNKTTDYKETPSLSTAGEIQPYNTQIYLKIIVLLLVILLAFWLYRYKKRG